jgi:pimeloyl-ACP methyl ester carboxylesterase
MGIFDTFVHKYLGLPYRLHVYVDNKSTPHITSSATVVLLHGIGNSGAAWDVVVSKLPKDIRVISIDLLGFGKSPSPRWMKYNTTIQARSVIRTLVRLGVRRQVTIVGHSMGGLIAVEIAKRYPWSVKSLILCSTPFYNNSERKELLPNPNKLLKDLYRLMKSRPNDLVNIAAIALRLNIVGKAFQVTPDNVDIYIAALESSIINQTALEDVLRINKPITLLHGIFDPVVIKKNLLIITGRNHRASISLVAAGHEMLGAYVPAIVRAIKQQSSNDLNA